MSKMPDKVKVHTYTYTIKEEAEPKGLDGSPAFGYCEYRNQIIVIDKELPRERKQAILMHELLHAVMDAINFDIKGTPPIDVEETIVVDMAPMLVNLLKDNPKLVKYILS